MTKDTAPLLIDDTNLSRAWARALLHVVDNPGTEISPLIVSISDFEKDGTPKEGNELRAALDKALQVHDCWDIETVAFTIFPQRYWALACGDRERLFSIYRDAFPRLQAMNPINNRRGLYFERLCMFGSGPCEGNQLEWIIREYRRRKTVRKSSLQATTFDPGRDHVRDAQLVFPCLQQVSFVPTESGLVVNGFYATQQLFDKAYGNYLGLAHLGAFMAHEMGLSLSRLNVHIGVAKLERVSKSDIALSRVISTARRLVASEALTPSTYAQKQLILAS